MKTSLKNYMNVLAMILMKEKFIAFVSPIFLNGYCRYQTLKVKEKKAQKDTLKWYKVRGCTNGETTRSNLPILQICKCANLWNDSKLICIFAHWEISTL